MNDIELINKTVDTIQGVCIGKNLLAYEENGTFVEVGFFGRILRWLRDPFTHRGFENCRSIFIVEKIVNFIHNYDLILKPEQRVILLEKISELNLHVKEENKIKIRHLVEPLLTSKEK